MTTKALCWSIVRRDGQMLLGTTLDRDLVVTASGFAGTYSAKYGITAANLKNAADLSVNNTEAKGALFDLGVSAIDLKAGLFDDAAVVIFETDWTAPSTVRVLGRGTLGQSTRDSHGNYTVEFRGLTQKLQNPINSTYSRRCIAELGSGIETPAWKRCGVGLSTWTVTGIVTGVVDPELTFQDTGRAETGGWFTDGKLTWTSGVNTSLTRSVRIHYGDGTIQLNETLPNDIAVDDAYTMTPGCDHQLIKNIQQQVQTPSGTVLVGSDALTVDNISGTTTTSGSVSVSGTTATFTGDGTLTITNVTGTTTITLSGDTLTTVDPNGTTHSLTTSNQQLYTGDCETKFLNGANYKGDPWMTGDDTLLRSQA